jgi:hypothetical protein
VTIKKYRIKGANSKNHPVGTICYDFLHHDYGLASDDTRFTGVQHVSVTLKSDGGYPSFTIPASNLEEIK